MALKPPTVIVMLALLVSGCAHYLAAVEEAAFVLDHAHMERIVQLGGITATCETKNGRK